MDASSHLQPARSEQTACDPDQQQGSTSVQVKKCTATQHPSCQDLAASFHSREHPPHFPREGNEIPAPSSRAHAGKRPQCVVLVTITAAASSHQTAWLPFVVHWLSASRPESVWVATFPAWHPHGVLEKGSPTPHSLLFAVHPWATAVVAMTFSFCG